MAIGKLQADITADTAVAGATMNALATGGYAWGAEINNSTDLYPYARFALALSAGVTVTTGGFLSVFFVEPDENGNYPASSGNPGYSTWVLNYIPPASTFQYSGSLLVPRIITPKYKWVLQNSLGNSFPASNAGVCTSRRFADAVV